MHAGVMATHQPIGVKPIRGDSIRSGRPIIRGYSARPGSSTLPRSPGHGPLTRGLGPRSLAGGPAYGLVIDDYQYVTRIHRTGSATARERCGRDQTAPPRCHLPRIVASRSEGSKIAMFEFICGGAMIIPGRMTGGSDPGFSGSSGATRLGLGLPHAGSTWSAAQNRQAICRSRQRCAGPGESGESSDHGRG